MSYKKKEPTCSKPFNCLCFSQNTTGLPPAKAGRTIRQEKMMVMMCVVQFHFEPKINGQKPNTQNLILFSPAVGRLLGACLHLRGLNRRLYMPVFKVVIDGQRQQYLRQNKDHDKQGLPGLMHPDMIGRGLYMQIVRASLFVVPAIASLRRPYGRNVLDLRLYPLPQFRRRR